MSSIIVFGGFHAPKLPVAGKSNPALFLQLCSKRGRQASHASMRVTLKIMGPLCVIEYSTAPNIESHQNGTIIWGFYI